MFDTTAQQAIYTTLNGNISATVYDNVPVLPSGQPAANFPYVNIGDATTEPWDTDDQLGAVVTVTMHIWSREDGLKQTKDIAGEIYDELHRATLTATGYVFVDCLHDGSQFMTDPDGVTRHGVVRYRMTIQAT